jgi:hypothetical protein
VQTKQKKLVIDSLVWNTLEIAGQENYRQNFLTTLQKLKGAGV